MREPKRTVARRDAEPASERMCVGCRDRHPPGQLVRFVRDPSGRIVIDVRQRAPGRGAWLSPERACVEAAVKRRALQRALSGQLEHERADALLDAMRRARVARALERLGLARRAGAVAAGTEAVREAMKDGRARLIWIASDASEGSKALLASNAERKQLPVIVALDGSSLARPIGMEYVAAVAVTGEPFATELLDLSSSLEDFSQDSGR
jgi:uncharacterized protein